MWTEGLVERIEHELEEAGMLGRPGGSRPCCSWTWSAPTSPRSAVTGRGRAGRVPQCAGRPVGPRARRRAREVAGRRCDGALPDPGGAVQSALELVEEPSSWLPPPMPGWRPGRWWSRAATTSAAPSTWPPASPPTPPLGRYLSAAMRGRVRPARGVRFVELGELELKGFARPVRLLRSAAPTSDAAFNQARPGSSRRPGQVRHPERGATQRR